MAAGHPKVSRSGRGTLAEGLYLEALALSRTLLDVGTGADGRADDCVAAFVVTHLNLSELHAEADETAAAAAYLCVAHRTLMALLRDPGADPVLQRAACRHSRETHAALLAHIAEHGSQPDIVDALRAGCLPFPMPASTTVH